MRRIDRGYVVDKDEYDALLQATRIEGDVAVSAVLSLYAHRRGARNNGENLSFRVTSNVGRAATAFALRQEMTSTNKFSKHVDLNEGERVLGQNITKLAVWSMRSSTERDSPGIDDLEMARKLVHEFDSLLIEGLHQELSEDIT